MRKLILALLFILGTAISASAQVAFSDDFNRTSSDSLGANWTEAAGDGDITEDTVYRLSTGSFGVITSVYNTTTGTSNHYVMIQVNTGVEFPWVVIRYTDSSSPYYVLQFNSDDLYWYRFDNAADTSGTQIGVEQAFTIDAGTVAGITITGTGNDTHIRVWRNPTGIPSAADNWNGDTVPDVEFTADPGASAVDSGGFVGIGGQQGTANTVTLDNFFGGTWETGGGPEPDVSNPALMLLGIGA